MGVTFTVLTSGSSTTDGTTAVTASVTPAAGSVLLAYISAFNVASAQPTLSSVAGGGVSTWTSQTSVDFDVVAVNQASLFMRRAQAGASPTSGAITFTFGQTNASFCWVIVQVTETDDGGTNGGNAIVQTAVGSDNVSPELSGTLAGYASTDNRGFVVYTKNVNNAALYTESAGWVRDGNVAVATPSLTMEWGHSTSEQTQAAWTQGAGSATAGSIIAEVKYLGAVGPPPPPAATGLQNNFQNGLADGATITAANSSGGTAGDGFSETLNMVAETDPTKLPPGVARGGLCDAAATTGAANGLAYVGWSITDANPSFAFTFYHPGTKEGYKVFQAYIRNRHAFSIVVSANGAVHMRDFRNNALDSSSPGLVKLPGLYKIQGSLDIDATDMLLNTATVDIFAPYTSSIPSDTLSKTSGDFGAPGEKFSKVRFGLLSTTYAATKPVLISVSMGQSGGISDTFTRADSVSSLTVADTGQTWDTRVGTWGIDTNQGYLATKSLGVHNESVLDTLLTDHKVSADLLTSPTLGRTRAGVLARYASDTAFLYLELNAVAGLIDLRKRTASGSTSLKSVALSGGGGFDGVFSETPIELPKIGATWYVAAPDSAKNAGQVYQMLIAGGYIYVSTWSANRVQTLAGATVNVNSLFRFNLNTRELDQSWLPDFNAAASATGPDVHAMAFDGTYVYVGGNFTSVGLPTLSTHSKLFRFNATTGVISSWDPGTINGDIWSMTVDAANDALYIGGQFTTIGGTTRNRMAAIKISDATLWSFNPNISAGPVNDLCMFTKTGGAKRVWAAFDGVATVAGAGSYTNALFNAANEASPGVMDWGKNEGTGGGHRVAASDDQQHLAYGTKGSGGNVVWVYNASGTKQYSGQSIATNGDIQALAYHKLGTGTVWLLIGTHDDGFATAAGGAFVDNNGSGFAAYLASSGAKQNWMPQFVQSGSTSPWWGGVLKLWSIKSVAPGTVMIGGVYTGARTSQVAGDAVVSPAPKRIAMYKEGGTAGSGAVAANTVYEMSLDVTGDVCTCVVTSLGVTIASFTHTLSTADASAYAVGMKIGIMSFPSSATDDDGGTRWDNLNATGGEGGGVIDPPPGTGSWFAESVSPYSGGGANSMSVDPINAGYLGLAMDVGGLRYSRNAGTRWEEANKGLCADQTTLAPAIEETRRGVATIVSYPDPRNNQKSVTIAGFGKSSNGGVALLDDGSDTWIKLNQQVQFESQNEGKAGYPSRPRTVGHLITVDVSGSVVYAADHRDQIWRSSDFFSASSPTWTVIATSTGLIRCLYIDPNDRAALYYGVLNGSGGAGGMYRIDNPYTGTSKPKVKVSPSAVSNCEDISFAGAFMFMACGTSGVWRSTTPAGTGTWTDLTASPVPATGWCLSIDAVVRGAAITVGLGMFQSSPGVFKSLNAQAGATWTSATGTVGNANDYGASQSNFFLQGSAPEVYSIYHDPTTVNRWFVLGGRGCYPYVSNNEMTSWTPIQDGATIWSTNDIAGDPTRANHWLFGIQDHDDAYSQNAGGSWTRVSLGPSTTGHCVRCDLDGVWWVTNSEGQAYTPTGLYRSSVASDGGAAPWNFISVAVPTTDRIAAISVGFVAGVKRIVMFQDNGIGFKWTANTTSANPSWTNSTGDPTGTIGHSDITPNAPIVWPDPSNETTLFFFMRSNTDQGLWRSTDGGASWTQIYAGAGFGTRRGYVAARTHTELYYTDTSGKLYRVRNANTVTSGTFLANRDTIAGVDDATAIKFGLDGSLLVFCVPTGSHDARVLRAENPPASGAITFTDLCDPTDGGANDVGRQLMYTNSINGDATHVFLTINGGSIFRFTKV